MSVVIRVGICHDDLDDELDEDEEGGRGRGVVWSTPVIANLQLCKSTDVPQLCGERDASRLCEHTIELR